jgi:hypothetical protein
MALVSYNPISQFSGAAQYAVHSYLGSLFGTPLVASIEDWMSPGKFTRQVPGSKLINDINIPIHEPGIQRFDGMPSFEEMSNIFVTVKRGTYKKGTKINTLRAAEVDLNAWSMAPSTMAVEIANNPYLLAVACLNGAVTGVPQTANGVALGFPELINTDQIYGGPLAVFNSTTSATTTAGAIPQWTTSTSYVGATTAGTGKGAVVYSGSNVYVNLGATGTSGATAPTGTTTSSDGTVTWTYVCALASLKRVNPADSSVLDGAGNSGWYNARQNWAITPDNILNALKNQQQRCAMNGVELGLGREGCELWVPYTSEEDFRLLTEVMRELAGSGQLSFSPIVVGGSTTTFASQPNPVFGRAKVRPVHGMRSDLWCVVSPPPAGHPEYAVFLHAFGGKNGEYSINPDGFDEGSNDSVPHIAMFTFDKNSAMFFGVPGVSKFGDVGILALVNEGVATQSGLLIDFNYTGAAS